MTILAALSLCSGAALGAGPDAALEAAVQRHLGIFLTTPDRREASESVQLRQGRLEIWFLRPITTEGRPAAVCDGARWLLTGRLDQSKGARAFFDARPDIEAVTLVFYALETQVQPDAQGRYVQRRNARPTARFTISREKARQLDPAVLRQTLVGARCATLATSLLDTVWTP